MSRQSSPPRIRTTTVGSYPVPDWLVALPSEPALLAHRRRQGRRGLLTGEDLCNLGPVARLQDLAMMALLGLEHVERNGHHYYRGLSMWPAAWQETVRAAHPDLYARHPDGFVFVRLQAGQLAVDSVNAAPFGLQPLLDPALLESNQ